MERVGLEQLEKENEESNTVGHKSRKRQKRGERDSFPKPKGGLTQAERVRALGVKGL